MKNVAQFLTGAASLLIIAAAVPSFAQTTPASSTPTTNISKEYSSFLTKVNSQQVVNDLRNGQWTTTVTDPNTKVTTTTTEPLPTGKMGYGNVKISLALAQESLRQQGITQPTSEQLRTAMVGDSKTSGILQMRADGMGWGQIAQKYDVKLGQLMSGKQPASTTTTTTTTTGTTTKGVTTANGNSSTNVTGKGNGKNFSGSDSNSGIVSASGRGAGASSSSVSQGGRGIVSASGRSAGQSGIVTASGNGHGASAGSHGNGGGQGKGSK